jgi:hypothetical protein
MDRRATSVPGRCRGRARAPRHDRYGARSSRRERLVPSPRTDLMSCGLGRRRRIHRCCRVLGDTGWNPLGPRDVLERRLWAMIRDAAPSRSSCLTRLSAAAARAPGRRRFSRRRLIGGCCSSAALTEWTVGASVCWSGSAGATHRPFTLCRVHPTGSPKPVPGWCRVVQSKATNA